MTSAKNTIFLEIRYVILMLCIFTTVCVYSAYTTWYFQSFGLGADLIGVLSAIAAVGAAVVSTLLGRLVDRSAFWTWKKALLLLLLSLLVLFVLLMVSSDTVPAVLCFVLVMLLGNAALPFLNSISVCLSIPFGPARAAGSLSYALTGLFLGAMIAPYGKPLLLGVGLFGVAVSIVLVLTLPEGTEPKKAPESMEKPAKPSFPTAFYLALIGCSLFMIIHTAINTYLLLALQEVGGNEADLGIATAISAGSEVLVLVFYGFIAKRVSSRTVLILSGLFYTLRGVLLFAAVSPSQIFLEQFLEAPSYAFYAAASVYYTNEVCDRKDRQLGLSLMGSTPMVGSVLGNVLGGLLINAVGAKEALGLFAIPAFIGVLFLLSARPAKQTSVKEG